MNNTSERLWQGYAASIPGSGHIRRETPCQDASAVILTPRPALIVCDGRGSAKLSHLGAIKAVKAFKTQCAVLEPFLANILDLENGSEEQWQKFCQIMYRTLAQAKIELSEEHNASENEFDFTVAFAVSGSCNIGTFQVGDGAIVLRQNGVCQTAFTPEKGDFANQTQFLRVGGENKLQFQAKLFPASTNSGIAATSDGPEHLMFKLPEMIPGKIFDAMFDDMRADRFCRQDILDYLTNRKWDNDPRGTDDRSLAVMIPCFEDSQCDYPEQEVFVKEEITSGEAEQKEPEIAPVQIPPAQIPNEQQKKTPGKCKKKLHILLVCVITGVLCGALMSTITAINKCKEKILFLEQENKIIKNEMYILKNICTFQQLDLLAR